MDYLLKTYMTMGSLEYLELLGSEDDLKLRQYFALCAKMEDNAGVSHGYDREACD